METNYVIGETYYYEGESLLLEEIIKDIKYPLRCVDKKGVKISFTLDGKYQVFDQHYSLSTSPTEFIAPKSKKEYGSDMVEQAITLLKSEGEVLKDTKVEQAIELLKSEGYTITKQY